MRKFEGEDVEFGDWILKRPRGYVLSTDRALSSREVTRLHRAGCFTLEHGFGGGTQQTVDFLKVCSRDPKKLNEWAQATLGYRLSSQRCQHCQPTSLGLTE